MTNWRLLAGLCLLAPIVAHAQLSVDLPLGVGIRVPTYDRVNGLSVPVGPDISLGDNWIVAQPLLTYRTQLGKVDPSLVAAWHIDSAVSLSASGMRGTFSNDSWIRSNLINSAYALFLGVDARNYFRADRAEGKITFALPGPDEDERTAVYVGVRFENAWSTGERLGDLRGPFSFYRQSDSVNGMERPNPLVREGHIGSVLLGGKNHFEGDRISNSISVALEGAWHTPTNDQFNQVTIHEEGLLRTWAGQQIEITTHLVTTERGPAPPQRYAYIGGSGSLATVDLFTMGGDHMYFVDALYEVPLPAINISFLNDPFIAFHFASGAASVGGFGTPTQNIGGRLGVGLIRVDFLVNPRTHQKDLGAGLSFSR